MTGPPTAEELDDLWRVRRAGARNFAGTTYQTHVAAWILVHAALERLPFTSIVPEGLEDIDCASPDGARCLIQAKEITSTNLGLGQLVETLVHAAAAMQSEDRTAIITNATLEGRLIGSGWDRSLADVLNEGATRELVAALAEHGVGDGRALLRRSHLIVLEEDALADLSHALAAKFAVPPEIAALVLAELRDRIGAASAEQRLRTRADPRTWSISELDALATRVISMVNRSALDDALQGGIVEHIGFESRSDLGQEAFLRGVDATPSHIAADLDVPRPALLDGIISGLRATRSVIIVGPSGSGKSAALWRIARVLSTSTRVVRSRRVASDDDVELLVHYVRTLLPTRGRPIVVCCDDLGRPPMSAWPTAARRLLDLPGVHVLGAAREEDVDTSIIRAANRLVRVALDVETARNIHTALRERGVPVQLGFDEAWQRSEGLLLEFVATSIGAERLDHVVGAQAEERFEPGRELELDVLRLVCTAHLAGVELPPDTLFALVGADSGSYRRALERLRNEHVLLRSDAGNWAGLHELRSEVVVRVAHRTPPPSIDDTLTMLVDAPSDVAAAAIVFAGRRKEVGLSEKVLAALQKRLLDASAAEAWRLLESAAIADASATAAVYNALARGARLPRLEVHRRVFLAMGIQDVPDLARWVDPEIVRLGSQLPRRVGEARTAAWRSLRSRPLAAIVGGQDAADLLRLLHAIELLEPTERFPVAELEDAVRGLAQRGDAWLALPRTCEHVAGLSPEQLRTMFGPLEARLRAIAQRDPNCHGFAVESGADELVLRIELMFPLDETDAHDRAIASCKAMRETCPEADVYEVRTTWPGGASYRVSDYEPANKRIPKRNLAAPRETNFAARVLDEVMRTAQTSSWTDWVRALAVASAMTARLVDEALVRVLNPGDSATRRTRWSGDVARLLPAVAELPRAPNATAVEVSRLDLPASVVGNVALALAWLDHGHVHGADEATFARVGAQLRTACAELEEIEARGYPTFADEPPPLPPELKRSCALLGDLLLSIGSPNAALPARRSDETWTGLALRIVDERRQTIAERELAILTDALSTLVPAPALTRIPRTDFGNPHSLTDIWAVLLDDLAAPLSTEWLTGAVTATDGALAGRVYVLWGVDDLLLPLGIVAYAERVVPLPRDHITRVAAEMGRRLPRGKARAATTRVQDALVSSSSRAWLAAKRAHVFGEAWDPDTLIEPVLSAVQSSVVDAPAEIVELLEQFADALAADVRGEEPGIIARALLAGDDPYQLTAALDQVHFRAMALDEFGASESDAS